MYGRERLNFMGLLILLPGERVSPGTRAQVSPPPSPAALMSALSTLPNDALNKDQFAGNDIEAARNSQGTTTSQSPLKIADESTLPPVDSGIKAWSVIGGAFLALFVQFGLGEFTRELKAIFLAS